MAARLRDQPRGLPGPVHPVRRRAALWSAERICQPAAAAPSRAARGGQHDGVVFAAVQLVEPRIDISSQVQPCQVRAQVQAAERGGADCRCPRDSPRAARRAGFRRGSPDTSTAARGGVATSATPRHGFGGQILQAVDREDRCGRPSSACCSDFVNKPTPPVPQRRC